MIQGKFGQYSVDASRSPGVLKFAIRILIILADP